MGYDLYLTYDTVKGNNLKFMGRIKRGGYIFQFWVGDHPPRHVHVFKDRKLIARVELNDKLTLMEGRIDRRIRRILKSFLKKKFIYET